MGGNRITPFGENPEGDGGYRLKGADRMRKNNAKKQKRQNKKAREMQKVEEVVKGSLDKNYI